MTRSVIDLGLKRVKDVLSKMDSPHANLPVIHVAGTNGKGTICNLLYHSLIKANNNVCMFTSPYLRTPNDSIMCSQRGVLSETKYQRMKKQVLDKAGKNNELTNFEITTVVALKWFQEKSPDWALIEVGLGGATDATNIFENPKCCVLTSISLDHTDILGHTLKKIATYKCGIFKPGSPIVAVEKFIPLECHDLIEKMAEHSNLFWVKTGDSSPDYRNTLKIATQKVLDVIGVPTMVPKNIPAFVGRLSTFKHPIHRSSEVILDGAHNVESVIALGKYIASIRLPGQSLNWILGFSKDYQSLIKHFQIQTTDTCFCVPFPLVEEMPWIKCEAPTDIAFTLKTRGCRNVYVQPTILEAIQCTDPGTLTVVTGSLYLVGEYARTFNL